MVTRLSNGHFAPDADAAIRFWANVDKAGPIPGHRPELGPCWLWTGAIRNRWGYGRFKVGDKSYLAHRAAWELTNGPIPAGQSVLHRCDNPPCVRPDHLFLGTHDDNMADMVAKDRHVAIHLTGEANPNARLTAARAEEIRGRRFLPERRADLARRYSVSLSTIGRILRGSGPGSWSA